MCGRYSLTIDEEFPRRYGLDGVVDVKTNTNISPGGLNPVITRPSEIQFYKWGLIPSWEAENVAPVSLINIKAETILEKNWAMSLATTSRCLIPATGFYEWHKVDGKNTPYYFSLKEEKYMSLAGLFTMYYDSETDQKTGTYSIITTTPNKVVEPYHHRMPVILQKDDEALWISGNSVGTDTLKRLLLPFPSESMKKAEEVVGEIG